MSFSIKNKFWIQILIVLLSCGLWMFCQKNKKEIKEEDRKQIENIASLEQELKQYTKQDSIRVEILNDLAWETWQQNIEKAKKYAQEALQLSQKIDNKKGMADAYNRLAIIAEIENDIENAKELYSQSLKIRTTLNDARGIAGLHANLGNLYQQTEKYDSSQWHYNESLRIYEEIKDTAKMARAHFRIAQILEEMGTYPEAYEHAQQFRFFVENNRDSIEITRAYSLLGHIRYELEMFGESKKWYEKALSISEKLDDTIAIAAAHADIGNVLDEMKDSKTAVEHYQTAIFLYQKYEDEEGLAKTLNNLADAYKHLGQYQLALEKLLEAEKIHKYYENYSGLMEVYNTIGDVYFGLKNYQKALEYTKLYFSIAEKINDSKFIQKGYKDFAKIYAALGKFENAFDYRVKYDELRYRRLDERRAQDFERKEALFSDKKIKQENERQQRELERKETQIAKNRATRNALLGGAAALSLFVLLLYNRNRLRAKANRELAQKNAAIEQERKRADDLLKNILPAAAAEELKLNNAVRPEKYESVTVMFTDFKSFTTIAEKMQPEDLVAELDECFKIFDEIIEKHGVEKIKTIGDAYMCVGGLPIRNLTHAHDVVSAALEMQAALQNLASKKRKNGHPFFEMRVGVHTGPVVAGVVGAKKFAYDIWGDTVNTAARMESSSEPNKVNVSESTWQLIKDDFECTFRGKIPAKNKGEIAMYFVEGRKKS